ncbi:MAG: ATP-dependent zinc metalloprotease FtsH [Bacillota bacterium]
MDNKNLKKGNNKRALLSILMLVLMIIVLAVMLTSTSETTPVLSYSDVMAGIKAEDGADNKIIGVLFVTDYNVNLLYESDAEYYDDFMAGDYVSATAIITYRTTFVLAVETYFYGLDAESSALCTAPDIMLFDPEETSIFSYIYPILYIVLLVGLGVMLFMSFKGSKGSGGAMGFSKTKARVATTVKVRFNDVAGAEEEKEELREVVEFLKSSKKFRDVGAKIPKGVLLVGSPGTGKTLFAKAVAGEASVPFFSISGSDFVEMFVGVGASRVRDLFQQAKKSQPCIIFIDEIDAVGRKRGSGMGGGNDEREQTLNQLLVQMDGFNDNDGIVVIAATNRVDVLDNALLRPGRFDRQIYINMPDVKAREAIFKVHTKNKPMSDDINYKSLARLTVGFSGADIANLLNESAILAARAGRTLILMKDIHEGINKVIAGPQKKSRVVTERDKRITAYHEVGHALVGRLMKYCDDVHEVSIIPRGLAAGYTISRPKGEDNHVTKNALKDNIAMMLGGRAAEELIIKDISTGASQDIQRATSIARKMVCEWGMSEDLANQYMGGEEEMVVGFGYNTNPHSDKVQTQIDQSIKELIDTNYQRALQCLQENEAVMHKIVQLLFEKETIYGDEMDKLLEGLSVEEVVAYIDTKNKNQQERADNKAAEDKRKAEQILKPVLPHPSTIIVPSQDGEAEEAKPIGLAPAEEVVTEEQPEVPTPVEQTEEAPEVGSDTKEEAPTESNEDK